MEAPLNGEPPALPLEEDLRASSDRMLAMLDRLRALEVEKRRYLIGSPDFIALAEEAEALSRIVFRWSQLQEAMAEESRAADPSKPPLAVSIDGVPPRPIHDLLADWRECELRLLTAPTGSAEAQEAVRRIEAIREEYRVIADAQRAAEREA